MRKNEIIKIIAGGGTVLNGWLAIANSFEPFPVAGAAARRGLTQGAEA